MKRMLVFVLIGPTLAVAAWSIAFAARGRGSVDLAATVGLLLFCFTMSVATVARLIDSALALFLPLFLRVPLVAVTGAIGGLCFGAGLWFFFLSISPVGAALLSQTVRWGLVVRTSMPFVVGGALCMGACSLLSHDYAFWQQRVAQKDVLPSNLG